MGTVKKEQYNKKKDFGEGMENPSRVKERSATNLPSQSESEEDLVNVVCSYSKPIDKLYLNEDQTPFELALYILLTEMHYSTRNSADRHLAVRYTQDFYKKIMRQSVNLLEPGILPQGFPSLDTLFQATLKQSFNLLELGELPRNLPSLEALYPKLPGSIQHLKAFYEEQNPFKYHDAVKARLLETLCFTADFFLNSSELFAQDFQLSLARDFATLIKYALSPICAWTTRAQFYLDSDAILNLKETGKHLTPFQAGKPRKQSKSEAFSVFQSAYIRILYNRLHKEFKEAKSKESPSVLENGLAASITTPENLNDLFKGILIKKKEANKKTPHEAAKKVLCKFLDVKPRLLNEILKTEASLLKKIKQLLSTKL
jgi:hypothetical protein